MVAVAVRLVVAAEARPLVEAVEAVEGNRR